MSKLFRFYIFIFSLLLLSCSTNNINKTELIMKKYDREKKFINEYINDNKYPNNSFNKEDTTILEILYKKMDTDIYFDNDEYNLLLKLFSKKSTKNKLIRSFCFDDNDKLYRYNNNLDFDDFEFFYNIKELIKLKKNKKLRKLDIITAENPFFLYDLLYIKSIKNKIKLIERRKIKISDEVTLIETDFYNYSNKFNIFLSKKKILIANRYLKIDNELVIYKFIFE